MNKFTIPGRVKQVEGSVLLPHHSGLRLILNLTSINGKLSSELENKLSKKWMAFNSTMKQAFVMRVNCKLGNIENAMVDSETWITSLYCLDDNNVFSTDAFEKSFKKLLTTLKEEKASLHVSNLLTTNFPEIINQISQIPLNGINLYFYKD